MYDKLQEGRDGVFFVFHFTFFIVSRQSRCSMNTYMFRQWINEKNVSNEKKILVKQNKRINGIKDSLVAQSVKNQPAKQETWVQSLGWKDPLEKGMATHSSILAWRIQWTTSLVGYSPWNHKESDTTERLSTAQHSLMHKVIWSTLSYEDKLKGWKTIKSSSLKESKS